MKGAATISQIRIHSEAGVRVQAAGPMPAPSVAERCTPEGTRGLHSPVPKHWHRQFEKGLVLLLERAVSLVGERGPHRQTGAHRHLRKLFHTVRPRTAALPHRASTGHFARPRGRLRFLHKNVQFAHQDLPSSVRGRAAQETQLFEGSVRCTQFKLVRFEHLDEQLCFWTGRRGQILLHLHVVGDSVAVLGAVRGYSIYFG